MTDQTLFSLAAEDAGGHGRALASGKLRSVASLHRGLALGASVDLDAKLTAELGRVMAAHLSLDAGARAHVDLEAAFPLDLFSEAGVVAHFAAGARAGVSLRAEIDAGIGVLVQALLAGRFAGPYREILDVYLAELTLSAGFWAELGFAAEARAEVRLVGSLLPGPEGQPPGFTFCFGHSAGCGVGAGADFVLDIGLADPARLLDRLADRFVVMLLDRAAHGMRDLPPAARAAAAHALPLARFLLPLSARSAFELGCALTHGGDARREALTTLVRCFVREAQEALARAVIELAIDELYQVMRAEWESAHAISHPVAEMLTRVRAQLALVGQTPGGTFDDGFRLLLGAVDSLLWAADKNQIPEHLAPRWREGVAVLWSAVCLLHALVRWADDRDREDPFRRVQADLDGGQEVAAYIARTRGIGRVPTLSDLVALLVSAVQPSALHAGAATFGRVTAWLEQVLAPVSGGMGLLPLLFTHLAEVTPEKAGWIAPVLDQALRALVERELVPVLLSIPALAGDEDHREILLRVVVPALESLGTVMWPAVLGAGDVSDPAFALSLRERISAVLLQLVSRFVVSAADVLSQHAHADGAAYLRKLALAVRAGGEESVMEQILAAGAGARLGLATSPDHVADMIDLVAAAIARRSVARAPLFRALDEITGLALGRWAPEAGDAEHLAAMIMGLFDATLEEIRAMGPEAAELLERWILR